MANSRTQTIVENLKAELNDLEQQRDSIASILDRMTAPAGRDMADVFTMSPRLKRRVMIGSLVIEECGRFQPAVNPQG